MPVPAWFYQQAAAVPYRRGEKGLEFLLITTPRKGRWIVPKGVIDPGRTPEQAARLEAIEEAGVRGTIETPTVGHYDFKKWDGVCHVSVFLLRVEAVLAEWPEGDRRKRTWVPPDQAIEMVTKGGLKAVLRAAQQRLESADTSAIGKTDPTTRSPVSS